jgi:hypothetical protein
MDPRRIQKTGTQGLSKKHKDNKDIIGAFQKRGTGGIEIPRISIFRLATQSIPDDTWTAVNFDYQEVDDLQIHEDIPSTNLNFTAESAGFWVINSSATFDDNDQHGRGIEFYLNNINTPLPQSTIAADASMAKDSGDVTLQSNFMIGINEGDTLKMKVWQDSNSTINLEHASFQAFRIGK